MFEMAHLDILMVMFLQHLQVCGQIGLSAHMRVFIHLDVKKNVVQLAFLAFSYPSLLSHRDSGRWYLGSERAAACTALGLYVQTPL